MIEATRNRLLLLPTSFSMRFSYGNLWQSVVRECSEGTGTQMARNHGSDPSVESFPEKRQMINSLF